MLAAVSDAAHVRQMLCVQHSIVSLSPITCPDALQVAAVKDWV